MNDSDLQDLQIRLAYQEQTLHELNEALTGQQKRLRELEIAFRHLMEQQKNPLEGDNGALKFEKPPHY